MNVPPEAVTAAGNAMRRLWIDRCVPNVALGDPMDWAQAALEAAAPAMATHAIRTASAEMFENAIRSATDDVMAQKLPEVETAARAAERERIRQLLLACRKCDRIHEPHPAVTHAGGRPLEYQSWAGPDGHAYQAPHLGRAEIAILLADPAPSVPAGGMS